MLIFRSEDHLRTFLDDPSKPSGESMTLDRQWVLARKWFAGRHLRDWKKRTPDEAQAVFESVGLTGDFWRLYPT